MFYVDAHCDSVAVLAQGGISHLDLTRMQIAPSGIQWMACFPPVTEPPLATVLAYLSVLDTLQTDAAIPTLLTASQLTANSWHVLRAVEGGDALCGSLANLEVLFDRGVRAMGLTWNHENLLSGGCATPTVGLHPFGRAVIANMEARGCIVDLAHISPVGFWDAVSILRKPFVVSHTAAHALHPHRRNLTDDQIRAVAEHGGVLGICLYPPFLGHTAVSLDTVALHIQHVYQVGGADCVGIGTDFDGIELLPVDVTDVTSMPLLFDKLSRLHVPAAVCDAIAGLNFARVLKESLPS